MVFNRRLFESKGSSSTQAIASIASFLPTLSLNATESYHVKVKRPTCLLTRERK